MIIDKDGRLFGRINLVDAAIGGFVVLLVPVAYAAYLLFRPPAPQITSVEFAQLTMIEERAAQGTELSGKLKVRGTGLRPVLRAKIGATDAVAFIFEGPTSADVLFGAVPSGTHDLVLYDGVLEVARAPAAVVIPEKPAPGLTWVAVAGTFIDMDEAAASSLKQGATFPERGDRQAEILAIGPVEPATVVINNRAEIAVQNRRQRAALLAVRCGVAPMEPRECLSGGVRVGAGVTFTASGIPGNLRFQIDTIVPATPPTAARVRVRLFGLPEAVALVRIDDVDLPHLAIDQRGAIIRAIGARREGLGDVSVLLSQEGASVLASAGRQDTVGSVDVTVTAGLDRSRNGWRYRGDPIRVGGPFTFTTRTYTLRGIILGLDIDEDGRPAPSSSDQR